MNEGDLGDGRVLGDLPDVRAHFPSLWGVVWLVGFVDACERAVVGNSLPLNGRR